MMLVYVYLIYTRLYTYLYIQVICGNMLQHHVVDVVDVDDDDDVVVVDDISCIVFASA